MIQQDAAAPNSKTALFGNVLEWVARASTRYPDRAAIRSGAEQISYRQLDEAANAIADCLTGNGIGPGSIVAVLTDDRTALPSRALGALKAGCVFVPLDPEGPPRRLEHVLSQLRADVVVASSASLFRLRGLDPASAQRCRLLFFGEPPGTAELPAWVEPIEARRTHPSSAVWPRPVDPDAPAYIYFTSGSTGERKGVVGRLSALSHRIRWELETFGITREWRVSQLISPTFDAYLRDLFVPLCAGGTLCVPPDDIRFDPLRLLEWLEAESINLVHCVPSVFAALAQVPARVRRLPELGLALLSGETLHVATVRRWRRRFGPTTRIVNLYGATEATMVQLFHVVEEADLARGFLPVGKPMNGDRVLLHDATGAPCDPGVAGEVSIQSPHLSLGYFRDETATRTAFGYSCANAAGPPDVYRTGDLGVELPDGNLKLLGRLDGQAKIRGVRFNLSEVEAALLEYPSIAACAVLAHREGPQGVRLVAYVEASSRDRPGVPELRAHLRGRLTLEMLPTQFAFLDHLPRTDSGKVDRQALAALPKSRDVWRRGRCPPKSDVERRLAEIWEELLGVSDVGVDDDFLDLGGHSLTATQLTGRIRDVFGVELPLRAVFEHPVLGPLARLIEQNVSAGPSTRAGSIAAMPLRRLPRSNPAQPSRAAAKEACNLVMVVDERLELASFERLAEEVRLLDCRIFAIAVPDTPEACRAVPGLPTLIIAPNVIRHLPTGRGRVCCGAPLSKHEEYQALGRAGIPVPPWALLAEDSKPDLSVLGAYVVRKPDHGAKGAEVRIVRRERVRWHPIVTAAAGLSEVTVLQRFIYTGPWPVSYRVNTLFGHALYAIELRARTDRPPLRGPEDFRSPDRQEGVSIVSNARDSEMRLCFDDAVIGLAERAYAAFPDIPLLGVDILREMPSGRLYVVEVNALGFNWNFTERERAEWPVDVESQFDGVRKAARVLAERTRVLAC